MGSLLSKSTSKSGTSSDSKATKTKRAVPVDIEPHVQTLETSLNNVTAETEVGGISSHDVTAISHPTDDDDAVAIESGTPKVAGKPFADPRSPYDCRTPLDALRSNGYQAPITRQLDLTSGDALAEAAPQTPLAVASAPTASGILQKKLLRNIGLQEFDPRSPTQFINRTPLRLAHQPEAVQKSPSPQPTSVVETSVDGDDETAHNVRNESLGSAEHWSNAANESIQAIELRQSFVEPTTADDSAAADQSAIAETKFSPAASPEKPSSAGDHEASVVDPRSPSVNVDRTPIVLSSTTYEGPDVENMNAIAAAAVCSAIAGTPKSSTIRVFEDDAADAEPNAIDAEPNATHLLLAGSPANKSAVKSLAAVAGGPRTPLGSLGNRVVRPQSAAPKHPILFIDKQKKHKKQRSKQSGDDAKLAKNALVSGGGNVVRNV